MSKKFFVKLFVVINLLVMGLLMLFSIRDSSPTSDEPPHLLSGYTALRYGHDYIDIEHPLLAKMFAASPLLFQDVKVNLSDPNYQIQKDHLEIGKMFATSRNFLNYKTNNPDKLIFYSRIPMIILTLAFGIIVFLLARRLFGNLAGIVAVFLYSTESIILANGSLINTDMPASGIFLLTIFALLIYSDRQTPKRLFFLIISLTLAVLTKFSALFLIPIVIISMEYIYRSSHLKTRRHIAYLLLSLTIIVSGFYGLVSLRDRGISGFLPLRYLDGAFRVFFSVSKDGRDSYLLGENYLGGRWYYFPVLLLFKTQILTLIGFLASLILIYLKRLKILKRYFIFTLFPIFVFFSLAVISKFNIGLRHVLPIYPILIIFAAGGFTNIFYLTKLHFKKIVLLITSIFFIIFLFGSRVWSLSTTYPHFLSYYNFISGGSDTGWKVAGDANYDWGQDVKRLAKFVQQNKIKSIAFDNYTGIYAAKDYYKLPVRSFSPSEKDYKGYVALSTSVITFHQNKPETYSWIVDNYKPIGRAGKSIFVYKID